MSKYGFIFPGQGSQVVGMGKELYDTNSDTKKLFEQASEKLNQDLADLCFNGPVEELNQTINTQPALLLVSYCLYSYFKNNSGLVPEAVAGHSLGKYTAWAAVEAGNFLDVLELVKKRASLMQDVEGAMAAIIGLKLETLTEITNQVGEVWPVNLNCPGQIVIAGRKEAVEKAMTEAKNNKAKLVKLLPVSIPSHCPLMLEAADQLKRTLEETSLQFPSIPIIQNFSAQAPDNLDQLKDNLSLQLSSPVRWEETILEMLARGIDSFIEVGPGNVLAGLMKRINRKVAVCNVTEMF